MGCPAQDFIREKDLTLRSYGLKEFTATMFKRVPGLEHFAPMVGNIFAQFNAYKQVQGAQSAEHSLPSSSCVPDQNAEYQLDAFHPGLWPPAGNPPPQIRCLANSLTCLHTLTTGQLEPALKCDLPT